MFHIPVFIQTAGLLILSNIFMTFAWYGHLRHLSSKSWLVAALVSWVWGWAYARGLLFGFEYRAAFMALFCLLFFAGVEGMCRAAARPASRESRLWLALWGLLAADYIFKISALYYYDAVQGWEFLALHLAAAYWVLARAGALTEGRTGPFLPLDGLRALVTVPFGNFFLRMRWPRGCCPARTTPSGRRWKTFSAGSPCPRRCSPSSCISRWACRWGPTSSGWRRAR